MNASISEESGTAICGSLTELHDELLVSAAKAGDRGAFVELSERHSKKVLPDDLPNYAESGRRGGCAARRLC